MFLEGLEVAFIVVTFGGTQHNVGLAALGAAAALVVVLIAGVIVHAPLTRVPENTLKFGVGRHAHLVRDLLERRGRGRVVAGRRRRRSSASIAFVVVLSFGLVAILRRAQARRTWRRRVGMRWIAQFGRFWYDFIVGDDWTIAVAVVVAGHARPRSSRTHGWNAWPVLPLASPARSACRSAVLRAHRRETGGPA